MIEQLSKVFPDARFRVTASLPDPKWKLPAGVELGREFEVSECPIGRRKYYFWYALRIFWLLTLRWFGRTIGLSIEQKKTLQWYKEASLIVYTGGANLITMKGGQWWEGIPAKFTNILLAKALGKPIAIYPATIGPYPAGYRSKIARFVLNRVDFIAAREINTQKYLESLGVKDNKIIHARDAAFYCPAENRERAIQLWEKHGVKFPLKKTLVTMALREWFYVDGPEGAAKWKKFVSIMGETCDKMGDESNEIIYLTTSYTNNNFKIAQEIQHYMLHPEFLKISQENYDAPEVKAMYGCADVLVTTRLHAMILALSSLTPVICIACMPKLTDMMDTFGLAEYCIPIEEITKEKLFLMVKKVNSERDAIREKIASKLPEVKEHSFKCAKAIAEIYNRKYLNKI
jgi:polysaccharide pyruvyl transferase WcaK-like protein